MTDLLKVIIPASIALKALIMESGDEESQEALAISMAIPEPVSQSARELGRSVREVNELRNTLIERFRKIIGGDFV